MSEKWDVILKHDSLGGGSQAEWAYGGALLTNNSIIETNMM